MSFVLETFAVFACSVAAMIEILMELIATTKAKK